MNGPPFADRFSRVTDEFLVLLAEIDAKYGESDQKLITIHEKIFDWQSRTRTQCPTRCGKFLASRSEFTDRHLVECENAPRICNACGEKFK